jgi:hypothetical protein
VDPFLDEVAEITRLRHEGAQVRVHPSPVAGRSYLVVTRRDPSGPVERRPVGAVPGTVDQKVLDTFEKEVHTPNRSLDRHLRSRLVYGGEPPPQALRERAQAAGVVLHSLAEYGGLIDLDRVQRSQRERLDGDFRYPNALYVPQRFRQEYPPPEPGDDARAPVQFDVLDRVTRWLGEDGARFVTVLGDFGRGKTFLMRQLVRALPERIGGLEPLLVELRTLEKGPDLFDVVRQHLSRLDIGDVTDAKVRHLITRGRVALLLDGFDELVQRITYPTAAAYLGTLLEAVTDEAKVVLTSRTQHFSDDRQIRTALLTTRTGREATRIVALEDFSDAQILRFLTRLYQGDQVRAQRRFTRLDEIKDLLGLSRNPRMLAFIAELPDSELDEAQRVGGTIRAADLYRKILDHWLQREVSRQRFRYGHRPLSEDHRRAACRDLALQLWTTREATGEVISPTELTETTAAALTELETLGFSAEQAAHAIGSGSLLTRTSAGFGFVHRSIMEWLVADAMATAVRSGQRSPELAAGEMSELMTDFFCDLAGHSTALSWADGTLHRTEHRTDGASDPTLAERANATRSAAGCGGATKRRWRSTCTVRICGTRTWPPSPGPTGGRAQGACGTRCCATPSWPASGCPGST